MTPAEALRNSAAAHPLGYPLPPPVRDALLAVLCRKPLAKPDVYWAENETLFALPHDDMPWLMLLAAEVA